VLFKLCVNNSCVSNSKWYLWLEISIDQNIEQVCERWIRQALMEDIEMHDLAVSAKSTG
jgi:hypothetical protein